MVICHLGLLRCTHSGLLSTARNPPSSIGQIKFPYRDYPNLAEQSVRVRRSRRADNSKLSFNFPIASVDTSDQLVNNQSLVQSAAGTKIIKVGKIYGKG